MNDVLKGRSTTLRRDLDQKHCGSKYRKEKIRIQNDYIENPERKVCRTLNHIEKKLQKQKKR